MLPLATGSRKRIGSCVSCCVRALLSISRYICDLWERHFVLGQHNEQHPWKTLQEPAWRQKRMCCCGGWAGWSWNAFLEDIAKLSLFYSRLPAMTKGWGIIMEWKKKQTMQKLSLKKKMHAWNQRSKSPITPTTELFIWILIVVVGLSLLAQPCALEVVCWMPSKLLWRSGQDTCKSSFASVLVCTGNKLLHSFLARGISQGWVENNYEMENCSFWTHKLQKWPYKMRFLLVSWSQN